MSTIHYRPFDGERLSDPWFRLLSDLRAAGVSFHLNEGHRTMARQQQLFDENMHQVGGVWVARDGHALTAFPSASAPHIRTGRFDHACDFNGAEAVRVAAARRGVTLTRTVLWPNGTVREEWHLEANASELLRYARKRERQIERARARREVRAAKARLRRAKERAQHLAGLRVTRVSNAAVAMVARFEGGQSPDGRFRAYFDKTGQVWTIGYGHTQGVKQGDVWTAARAHRELKRELNLVYAPHVAALRLPLTQPMFDAVVSAIYNLGPGVLDKGRSLGDALRNRTWNTAAMAFGLYVNSGGQRLAGLVMRRAAERDLFLSGIPRP